MSENMKSEDKYIHIASHLYPISLRDRLKKQSADMVSLISDPTNNPTQTGLM